MTGTTRSSLDVSMARMRVSEFVRVEARTASDELGFGWRPAEITPQGLDEMKAELQSSHRTGLPFRVLGAFSDSTIFDSPETNLAMRFWHDIRHVWLGADYSVDDELEVASCHLARAKAAGFGLGSTEYRLLYADTVAQTLFTAQFHCFVVDQRRFAMDYAEHGFDAAIEREVIRSELAEA